MKRMRVRSTGAYLPEKVLTNFDLEKMVDTSDEWIRTRTGIVERHIAADDEATSDLVVKAAREALERGNLTPEDIDAIIVATVTPDTAYPSTACWVQKGLNVKGNIAFDINAACSGFIYATAVAQGLIATGVAKTVLVAGAEIMSRFVNWEDRSTCVLFGDGAGVVIYEESDDDSGLIDIYLGADGTIGELLIQPAGGTRMPPSHETVEKKLHTVHMQGNEVFKHAVRMMQEASLKVLEHSGYTADDVDLFVPHQANIRIIEATIKRVGIPWEKTMVTIDKFANVPAATIPLTLHEAVITGKLKKGDLVLSSAFGGGFTWGAFLMRW
ncbi:3-oxoacyl-ACP synthase [bacterium]|nr:MAG: 3-oxoacyl-ACP synthase [bacterium]RKZ27300.1 MAG: 3-oxoacyl-ACP synthase [bacterium]